MILKKKLTFFICIFSFILIIFFQTKYAVANSMTMNNYQTGFVTEELRLKVPENYKEIWLEAEKKIWEPWLSIQNGFLDRQIFWDKKNEEALILVNWENKKLWKSITEEEVEKVQERFEDEVKTSLELNENPFKLIYEGELDKQG